MSRRTSAVLGASLLVGALGIVSPDISGAEDTHAGAPDATGDLEVFRPYAGVGGLQDVLVQLATDQTDITNLVAIGHTVQGTDIVAIKVSRDASRTPDGDRPAILYLAAQHARERITPEMVRRLAHHVINGYGNDPTLTDLVDTSELWFVPVANPDGYDYTFTPGGRYWRKNLRDNDGDGRITANDGVDLNRNYPTKWGYDDEGSSPDFGSDSYRGSGPASEPESRAVDRLMARVGFEFFVNYHSAAEEVLYGTSWQVSTPTPDDVLYEALTGDAAGPAVPGFNRGLWADLYTGNGIADEHAHIAYGTLALTVEMSTCQTASSADTSDDNGRTIAVPPTTCAEGSLLTLHPFLSHYLTSGKPCQATGTTGSWNAFTGESNGWVAAAFDLSAYAGREVDVRLSYVTDVVDAGVAGGIGVFVDDTRLTIGGADVDADGFETEGGNWAAEGPPEGSPPGVHGSFVVATELIPVASSVTTEDTALLGFGIESLATATEQADVLGRLVNPLLGR